MRLIVQRVANARVVIDDEVTSSIDQGLLVYMGIHRNDQPDCRKWAEKLVKLRIFADEQKPINRSVCDINGEILVVSQFTLYGDAQKQNRPSFIKAAPPETAKPIYDEFLAELSQLWPQTYAGRFAADMQVHSVNDGPVTILLDNQ